MKQNAQQTQTIHVWYIYLHLPYKSTKCRLIYHTWILWENLMNYPSSELAYSTLGKWKSPSTVPLGGDMLVPWRVYQIHHRVSNEWWWLSQFRWLVCIVYWYISKIHIYIIGVGTSALFGRCHRMIHCTVIFLQIAEYLVNHLLQTPAFPQAFAMTTFFAWHFLYVYNFDTV